MCKCRSRSASRPQFFAIVDWAEQSGGGKPRTGVSGVRRRCGLPLHQRGTVNFGARHLPKEGAHYDFADPRWA